jgi:colanic acid/amylovoran biosynthesis glycosyltransferase
MWWESRFTKVSYALSLLETNLARALWHTPWANKSRVEKLKYWYLQRYLNKVLVPYCKRNDIQLVHAHFANAGFLFLELKKRTGIPYVVSFYGMDYEYLPNQYPEYIEYYKAMFEHADGFICEGKHGKKILTDVYGVKESIIEVVHLGVETSTIPFIPREKKHGSLKLVQIASFVEKKGHQYTIAAFGQALKKCPDLELTLVGNGPLKKELLDLVAELNLTASVTFLDFIDYNTLHTFLGNFHAFIHPSCYSVNRDCEGGAPVVLLDAQCTGMPVIATTHCDIPSEVLHGITGLLSEEKNVDSIAKNIIEMYEMKEDEYQRFSANARSHVLDNYSVKKNTAELKKYYEKVVNR